jgi:O-antigen ligase
MRHQLVRVPRRLPTQDAGARPLFDGTRNLVRHRRHRWSVLAILVAAAMVALSLVTATQSYLNLDEVDESPAFAAIRLLVLPAVLLCWVVFHRGRHPGRRVIWPLESVSALPLLTVCWFALGSMFSMNPVGSTARTFALFSMIWGSSTVLGPALINDDGGRGLVTASFWSCLLISFLSALAAAYGGSRGWGLMGDRYYGPIAATMLGPICVAGIISGCILFRLENRSGVRAIVAVGGVLLLTILVLSRARGSYVACVAGVYSLAWVAACRRSVVHVGLAIALTGLVGAAAYQLHDQDFSRSDYLHFLRLDNGGMLDQRVEVWNANAELWTEHPIVGVGLGNEAILSELSKRSHSAYLSVLNEGGVPAVVLLVASLVYVGYRSARLAVKGADLQAQMIGSLGVAAVSATSVLGLVETTLINAASTFNLFVWLSIGAATFASRSRVAVTQRRRRVRRRSLRYEPGYVKREQIESRTSAHSAWHPGY